MYMKMIKYIKFHSSKLGKGGYILGFICNYYYYFYYYYGSCYFAILNLNFIVFRSGKMNSLPFFFKVGSS